MTRPNCLLTVKGTNKKQRIAAKLLSKRLDKDMVALWRSAAGLTLRDWTNVATEAAQTRYKNQGKLMGGLRW